MNLGEIVQKLRLEVKVGTGSLSNEVRGGYAETLKTLVVGNPGVDFLFEHRKGTEVTCFDTGKGGQ